MEVRHANRLTSSSRFRCRECGFYFKEEEGIPLCGFCFDCIPYFAYPTPEDLTAYLFPIAPTPDPEEIAREKQLTRLNLALYFLTDALIGVGASINPHFSAKGAMRIFQENFPEFSGPLRIDNP